MAGPNGSGKSTVLREVRNNFYSGPFVNADEIEKSFRERGVVNITADYSIHTSTSEFAKYMASFGGSWKQKAAGSETAISLRCEDSILLCSEQPTPYDAAVAADFIRHQLLEQNKTFTFETVMSHTSKIEFLQTAKAQGYKNYLYFICTASPSINISRIAQRVKLGGHNVAEEKIRKRYADSLEILPQIVSYCHRCYFFDNSAEQPSIDPIASIGPDRQLSLTVQILPWWLKEFVIDRLYKS